MDDQEKDALTGPIYEHTLSAMKSILDLGQFKIGDRNSKEYGYFKAEVMNYVYGSLKNIYEDLEDEMIVRKCNYCDNNIRTGWKKCSCRGCGYLSSGD